jgi:hypothetical protein
VKYTRLGNAVSADIAEIAGFGERPGYNGKWFTNTRMLAARRLAER